MANTDAKESGIYAWMAPVRLVIPTYLEVMVSPTRNSTKSPTFLPLERRSRTST
ncbi:hypothetical protein L210DRAFT_939663 [Boletus edulis BED1]|uniref:Uncharacterized protein n=1 Tax=Boletus edulis BED1 TaxID=1328754 RepID=A0AAD4GH76_BOLED|nr:hypothetical protein L210DRAFT_939663 [Boletus edulis BED1]